MDKQDKHLEEHTGAEPEGCDQLGGVRGGIRQPAPPHCGRRFSAGPGNREWHGTGHARDGHTDNGGRPTSRCICGSDVVCCRLHITLRASLLAKLAIGERLLLRRADLGLLERLRREMAFRVLSLAARVCGRCVWRAWASPVRPYARGPPRPLR